ncbi:MAG: YaiI/YqxD family protein [Candidatus Limiplasma sp.]|nr:YaiI/YqxD family protein [Candidatus Limiplasma sp.]
MKPHEEGRPRKLLIDADACPVTDIALGIARKQGVPVVLVCDDAHRMRRAGAETITVSQGADSVDFRLVNLLRPGDVVVTQDYGLAAMCLARSAKALHQDGWFYTDKNIDGLLMKRHAARQARRAGNRVKGPPKRSAAQDEAFARALENALTEDGDML